jgi:hypothetical protein
MSMYNVRCLIAGIGLCAAAASCKIDPYGGPFSCKNGEACPPGQVCGADALCQPRATEVEPCTANEDCEPDHVCVDGECIARSKEEREGGVDSGPDAPQPCTTGALQCAAGNVPEVCEDGKWVKRDACSGSTPACTNGVCAAVKLQGSIVTVADTPVQGGAIRLVEHGLEYTAPACGNVQNKMVCVSGGIVP